MTEERDLSLLLKCITEIDQEGDFIVKQCTSEMEIEVFSTLEWELTTDSF